MNPTLSSVVESYESNPQGTRTIHTPEESDLSRGLLNELLERFERVTDSQDKAVISLDAYEKSFKRISSSFPERGPGGPWSRGPSRSMRRGDDPVQQEQVHNAIIRLLDPYSYDAIDRSIMPLLGS